MASLLETTLLLTACGVLFGAGINGKRAKVRHHSKHHVARSDSTFSLWGNSRRNLVYEGCFESNGEPAKERSDSQNNNFYCNDFCNEESTTYSATTGDQCLCFNELPSNRLSQHKCDTKCPDDDFDVDDTCSGLGCCGSTTNNAVSVFKSEESSRDKPRQRSTKRSIQSVDVQGCFDDMRNHLLNQSDIRRRVDDRNTALRCTRFCSDKGFAVASIRGSHCYCNNDLPLDRLYVSSNGTRECSIFCPGVWHHDNAACVRDECCGGTKNGKPVYTVIIAGNVDVLKQFLGRLYNNIRSSHSYELLENVFGAPLCEEDWEYYKGTCIFRSVIAGGRRVITKSYSDAKRDCENRNSQLATIKRSEDLADELWSASFMYIGLEYNTETNTWIWVTGEPITYNVPGFEPTEGEPSCAVVMFNDLVGHVPCNENYGYYCQRHAKISIVANRINPSGDGAALAKYTLDLARPDVVTESSPPSDSEIRLALRLENLVERIRHPAMRTSSEHLGGYDMFAPNKDGQTDMTVQYQHSVQTSESTEISISGGMSVSVTVGTEFSTSMFGLAEARAKAELSTTGFFEHGTTTVTASATTQTYTFTFPVPPGCDASIMIMKEKIPTRVDWRAEFFISGTLELQFMDQTRVIDISRIVSGNDRYVYGFGSSKFGDLATVVPKKTLDCIDEENNREERLSSMERRLTSAEGK